MMTLVVMTSMEATCGKPLIICTKSCSTELAWFVEMSLLFISTYINPRVLSSEQTDD